MERKTKQRILGIFVLIGLVIMLLPFFQGKELKTETVLANAPPFPNPTVQVATVTPVEPAVKTEQMTSSQPSQAIKNDDLQDDNPLSVVHPSVINQPLVSPPSAKIENSVTAQQAMLEPQTTKAPVVVTAKNSEIKELITKDLSSDIVPVKTDSLAVNSHTKHSATKTIKVAKIIPSNKNIHAVASGYENKLLATAKKYNATSNDGLAELKNAAWVIQIGSFKNKANALRLVNQLRANGYRAFIQQISTALGENTRVFIGPEMERTHARALANRLESEMHIRGIIISYKPLTL